MALTQESATARAAKQAADSSAQLSANGGHGDDAPCSAALETREPDAEERDRAGRNGRGTSAGAGRCAAAP